MSGTNGSGHGTARGSLPPKLYFRIGEVAGLVGVEPHVLRYWEREFRSIRPTKSAKGQRVYSRRDVENLLRVRDLLYSEGFTIAGAKKRLLRAGVEPTAQGAASPSTVTATAASIAEPTASPTASATAGLLGAPHAAPAAKSVPAPASGAGVPRARVQEKLGALRVEVEAFLKELGG